ncbi:MAG: GGDEF domain-containing protein, partial [Lachnospiraceae bacterium]|nr:GGDEF domain-containing protein [Lachnospiraceae bacterium]
LYEYIDKAQEGNMTLFLIDLDHFKSINDIYGHQEGDRALVLTADTLRANIKIQDGLIVRAGGDEFVVLMFGTRTPEEVEQMRQTIKAKLDTEYAKDEHLQKISASVGSSYSQTGKENFDVLVGEADAMMYREKEKNR